MKKNILTLLFSYLVAIILFIVLFSSCSTFPISEGVGLNLEVYTCETDSNIVHGIHPNLEIFFDGENFTVSSDSVCFSFYLFDANRDTIFNYNFEIDKPNKFGTGNNLLNK